MQQSPGELAFLQAMREHSPATSSGGPIDLLAGAGIPSPYPARGIQLAGALVPPTAGGDRAGAGADAPASPPAAPPTAPADAPAATAQAKADWYLAMARQAQGSSNPRIRAQAGVLEAQGQALQRSADRQTALSDRQDASREARQDREANRGELSADRAQRRDEAQQRLRMEGERLQLERDKQNKPDDPADFGKGEDGRALNRYVTLYPKIALGTATPGEQAAFEGARTHLLTPRTVTGPTGTVVTTPQLPDLSGTYGPLPSRAGGTAAADQPTVPGQQTLAPGTVRYPETNREQDDKVSTAMLNNADALRRTSAAIDGLTRNPTAIGVGKDLFPRATNWFDPGGTVTRAMIADIGSLKLHDRSGAAVTASEMPRLSPFIPSIGDTREAAMDKLQKFRQEYRNILSDQYEVYGPKGGYRSMGPVERSLSSSPVRISGDEEYDRLQPGQAFIGPDGKTRTK